MRGLSRTQGPAAHLGHFGAQMCQLLPLNLDIECERDTKGREDCECRRQPNKGIHLTLLIYFSSKTLWIMVGSYRISELKRT